MTEKSTHFKSQSALVVPNGFIIGEAVGGGDCFFDSVAQGMNELYIDGGPFDAKVLRRACFNYSDCNQGSVYDCQSHKTWRQAIEEDAVAGGYATNREEQDYFYNYMGNIRLRATESLHLNDAIWGRPEIEGRMLCQTYGIKIHIIEYFYLNGQEVICHQLVDSSGSRSLEEHSNIYNDPQVIHILNEGFGHFVPLLHKATIPMNSIQKVECTYSSEGVLSQDNPADGLTLYTVRSVAASPLKESLFVAPVHPEQGPVKAENDPECKTYQEVDTRYVKVCSLTDKSTWVAVAAKKIDDNFKVLRIRNSPTVTAALEFMQQAEFFETFNLASHWFFIVIEVDCWSELTSKALDCLVEFIDKQKPVIIQWDIKHSAQKVVFYKQVGQSALTRLQIISASLFSTEEELIFELSKQGSFQLPLLLNALRLGIGGKFNGVSLDLLDVSFDMKQEIDTWRLIDYAARDDDCLSLRYLLLVNWDLEYQNRDGRKILQIAAEYGGPQSISTLLNLPITILAEHVLFSSKAKELLTLKDYYGDSPLLIAAEKGRPETLHFLVRCGADIQCHKGKNEKETAIELAWDKKRYKHLRVLLDADSPFPDNFELGDIEKSENSAALLKQVEDRQRFHQAIKEGLQNNVKQFIKRHPRLKLAYDPSNQSALMTALEADQYEIFALLICEGLCAGKNEDPSLVIEGLSSMKKSRLKEAKKKYFRKQDDAHIVYLMSKSKLGTKQQENENRCKIQQLYKELDSIPEISIILKVVEQSELLEIIFDFDNESIVDLDPTYSSENKGACNHKEGRIYIGAKQGSELLGILAHELTHLAMQICYNNECSPYEVSDKQTESHFGEIISNYCKAKGKDKVIERVFTNYEESIWPAELIVRVPHILAHYKEEKGKLILTQQAQELFNFYVQHTQENFRKFIENPAYFKSKHKIQCLNRLLGKIDEIENFKVWLNDECLLNKKVIHCQECKIISSSLPRLTVINLYQVMCRNNLIISHNTSDYIFISGEQFKIKGKADAIHEAYQSFANLTLVIDCSSEYHKWETELCSTLKRFSEKRRIIFVAGIDVARSLEAKFKNIQIKIIPDRQYEWGDLTSESKTELLKSKVHFQGSPIFLKDLISPDSPVTNYLPLADLLNKKTLEIGRPLLTSNTDFCIENYYIPRTFNHHVAIKKDVFEKKITDLVITTEQEFRKCCQYNPNRNVHWLLEDESGRFIWQQSQGSLRALRKYIDMQNPHPYPPENLEEFLQQAQCQKVILIADTAGMGKTTVLTYLSQQIKEKWPAYWLIRIDLKDHTDVLEAQAKQKIGIVEILCEKFLKLSCPFQKELFKHCCQDLDKAAKVVLMLDGLDEVSPKYKRTILDLLQDINPLKQPLIEQLWITTRPHLREELEDNLQRLSYTLEPFSEDNQIAFLTKFWNQHSKIQERSQKELVTYATALIKQLAKSISDKEKELTGIPLQTRLLAEVFEEKVKTYIFPQKSDTQLFIQLRLVDIYRKFIIEKINIFMSKGKIAEEQYRDMILCDISITKIHQNLALEVLMPEVKRTVLKLEKCDMLSPEAISRIGIVKYVDHKLYFIHRTFAEYFVAGFLATQLTKKTRFHLEMLNILFNIILEEDYAVICFFLNELLVIPEKSELLKKYGQKICKIWKAKCLNKVFTSKKNHISRKKLTTVLGRAAADGLYHIIDFVFSCLKATNNSGIIARLLLHKDRSLKTLWHLATKGGHLNTLEFLWRWGSDVKLNLRDEMLLVKDSNVESAWVIAAVRGDKKILEKLWCWGREVEVNLKDDLLLAKHRNGYTAWLMAARGGDKDILEKLWCWGREVHVNLKNDLLLSKDRNGETAWVIAAVRGYKEVLEKLWFWGREVQVNLKEDLLLAKDRIGVTAWVTAAERGDREILEILWFWGIEVQVNLKDDLLLAKHRNGYTAWVMAARGHDKETLEKLWCWGREVQVNLKYDLLLAKNRNGYTAWVMAAQGGHKEILEKLWCWGREVKVNLKDDLLLAKYKNGYTAWVMAARECNKDILEKLWCWGREVQVNLKYDLLLAKDTNGETAWIIAAVRGNKEILETLWCWGRELQVNLKYDLLQAKDMNGESAWVIAAGRGNKEILEKLWGWGREVQVNLKYDLLLAKDRNGETAWFIAAVSGNKDILEKLWCWGTEVQVNLKNELLLAKDTNGENAWVLAAVRSNKEILEKLWCWGREMKVNLKDELLLAKDRKGETAWFIAAERGDKEFLKKLWSWGRELQVNLKDELLLAKDRNAETAWDLAAERGDKEILESLWSWGREVHVNLKDDLLLAKGRNGKTAWDLATERCDKDFLETLWCWGREVHVNLKDDLLSKDLDGRSAWSIESKSGDKKILQKLWCWGTDLQVNFIGDLMLVNAWHSQAAFNRTAQRGDKVLTEDLWFLGRELKLNLKDDLLLAKDWNRQTAWLKAARSGYKEILEKLWCWGREAQVNLKDYLLLSKDSNRETAWFIAAHCGYKEILENLWCWGREVQVNLKDEFLLAKDRNSESAWIIAAVRGDKEILENLWRWGREVQVNLKYDLLLAKDRNGEIAWLIAAVTGNKEILEKLWCWGRETEVNLKDELLLAQDRNRQNAWIIAAVRGDKEILEKLWCWGREVKVNLKDDLLLAKQTNGYTAWVMAARRCDKEILEKLWCWGREVQLNLKYDLLLAKDMNGEIAWVLAALRGNKEILKILWFWGREIEVNLKDDLLLAKDRNGETAWYIAAERGDKKLLEELWTCGTEVQVNLKDDLLLAKDRNVETAWNLAAERGDKGTLEILWSWGKEVHVNLKDDLLLAKGRNGKSAWELAAERCDKVVLETLWCWGGEVQVNLKDDLLLGKGRNGKTAWECASERLDKKTLETLWCWGREMHVNLKGDLLLAKDSNGRTAWVRAAICGDKEILHTLWSWGSEVQVNLKDDLLLTKDWDSRTAWTLTAERGDKDVLETLWFFGRDLKVNLKDDLLLAKDWIGRTAWVIAAQCGYTEILELLWCWGREAQVNLKEDLLLSTDANGKTAWIIAARSGYKEILEKLWCWGREMQVNLKDDLLLAKDWNGKTAWVMAKERGDKDILEKLWCWCKEIQVYFPESDLFYQRFLELEIIPFTGDKNILLEY